MAFDNVPKVLILIKPRTVVNYILSIIVSSSVSNHMGNLCIPILISTKNKGLKSLVRLRIRCKLINTRNETYSIVIRHIGFFKEAKMGRPYIIMILNPTHFTSVSELTSIWNHVLDFIHITKSS